MGLLICSKSPESNSCWSPFWSWVVVSALFRDPSRSEVATHMRVCIFVLVRLPTRSAGLADFQENCNKCPVPVFYWITFSTVKSMYCNFHLWSVRWFWDASPLKLLHQIGVQWLYVEPRLLGSKNWSLRRVLREDWKPPSIEVSSEVFFSWEAAEMPFEFCNTCHAFCLEVAAPKRSFYV